MLSTGIERSYCFFLFSVDTISIDCPWLVLDQKDNQLLLISALGIDSRKYHNDSMYVTWRMSNIRNWLNTEFVETAFSADESERIITEQVIARSSLIKGTDQGDNTEDKVFLLSYDEVLHQM